jgi:hypothetical protein
VLVCACVEHGVGVCVCGVGGGVGLDEMLVAHWLTRIMVGSDRLGSARLNFFTS